MLGWMNTLVCALLPLQWVICGFARLRIQSIQMVYRMQQQ